MKMFISRKRVAVVSTISPIRSGCIRKSSMKMKQTHLYHNINLHICSLKSSGYPYWMRDRDYRHLVVRRVVSSYITYELIWACWLLAVIFAVCLSAAFWWHNSQLSLLLCVWAFIEILLFDINCWTSYKSQSLFCLCSNSELICVMFGNFYFRIKCSHATSCTGRHISENSLFLFWPWLCMHNRFVD